MQFTQAKKPSGVYNPGMIGHITLSCGESMPRDSVIRTLRFCTATNVKRIVIRNGSHVRRESRTGAGQRVLHGKGTIPSVWRLTHCAPIPDFPSISARMSGSAGHDETSASSERTLTGAR